MAACSDSSTSFLLLLLGRLSDQTIQTSVDGKHLFISLCLPKIFYINIQSLKFLILFFFRYIAWILVAALYHLPNFQSMGLDLRMNLSLFLTIYISSIVFLVVFHIIFLALWYVGLVSRVAGRRPEILTILQNCTVSSPPWESLTH